MNKPKVTEVGKRTTVRHAFTVEGYTDRIPKDYTRKVFRPEFMAVEIEDGEVTSIRLRGPRILARGEGEVTGESFSFRAYRQAWESLGGTPCPAWAVEIAEGLVK